MNSLEILSRKVASSLLRLNVSGNRSMLSDRKLIGHIMMSCIRVSDIHQLISKCDQLIELDVSDIPISDLDLKLIVSSLRYLIVLSINRYRGGMDSILS